MLSKSVRVFLPVITLALFICFCNKRLPETEWGNLHNLGPTINSTGKDEHASLTSDGEVMYFASIRENGFGDYDLYSSHFIDGKWLKAFLLPEPLNTKWAEFDPFITLDGSKLFFASNRNNSAEYWDCDIFYCTWDGKAWTEPQIFDSLFITPGKPDWGPTSTADLNLFIFSSGRDPAPPNSVQIFCSNWLEDKWSKPQLLPAPVNSAIWEATPYLTPDGRFLYLNSGRGEPEKKDVDIWSFEYINNQWQNSS